MARKAHLVAMTDEMLEAYKDRLYAEVTAILAEREVRKSLAETPEETVPLFDLEVLFPTATEPSQTA